MNQREHTFQNDILNLLFCVTDLGRLQRENYTIKTYVLSFVTLCTLFFQGCLTLMIYFDDINKFITNQKKLDIKSFLGLDIIMMLLMFAIFSDVRGKIIIMLESQRWTLKVLAFLSFIVNIITLSVVHYYIGTLDNIIDKFINYGGFLCLISIDNAVGIAAVYFFYSDE